MRHIIINFSIVKQYNFLYSQNKNIYYHIWGYDNKELHQIYNFIKNKNHFKNGCWLNPNCSIKKNFYPIPFHCVKQNDNLYHAYISFKKE